MINLNYFNISQNNNIKSNGSMKSNCYLKAKNGFDTVQFKGNPIKKTSQVGKYIKNIGLIIKETKVFNVETKKSEECYVIYQNLEKDGVFRLIKKDPAKIKTLSFLLKSNSQIMDILKKYSFHTADKVLSEIKTINPKVVDLFNDLTISEIAYTTLTEARGKQRVINAGYKCESGEDIVAIENFIVKQAKYLEANRFVALPLLKALKQNGDQNILVRALAIGENSSSPVDLYLKSGFIPFKKTLQDIESHRIETPKGNKVDPKYEVTMYLPKNARLYKLIEKNSFLDDINNINPNWFKRLKKES